MQRFKTTAARKLIENMEGEKDYIYAIISDNVWVSRFPVSTGVQWSCYVTTKTCPMTHGDENKTLQRYRTTSTCQKMASVGLTLNLWCTDSLRKKFWAVKDGSAG